MSESVVNSTVSEIQQYATVAIRSTTRAQPTEMSNAETAINHVHAAPFWHDEPALWFTVLEIQFDVSGVTSDLAKLGFVLSKLNCETAKEISDVLNNLPAKNRYEVVKKELIRRLSPSQHQRIQQLLKKEEIGDRTPSKFLRCLKALVSDMVISDEFWRTLWISRLPPTLRPIVTAMDPSMPLNEVATVADRVYEIMPQVASVSRNSETLSMENEIADLRNQIADLTREFRRLCSVRQRTRSRSLSRKRRSRSPAAKDHCWYHQTYGDRSTKCRQPCSYQSRNVETRH